MDSFTQIHSTGQDAADARTVAHAENAQFLEYGKAADSIRASLTPRIPFHFFPPSLYGDGPSRVVPPDLSEGLKCPSPATGPDVCANFIRIIARDSIALDVNATSMVFHVIRGAGSGRPVTSSRRRAERRWRCTHPPTPRSTMSTMRRCRPISVPGSIIRASRRRSTRPAARTRN